MIDRSLSLMVWGWGGQFLIMIPALNTVIVANQSIEDGTNIRQEIIFTSHIYAFLLRQL